MSRNDGAVIGAQKVQDHGPSEERWDLVVMGDGFTQGELGVYEEAVAGLIDAMFSVAPFNELRRAINVHRVDVVSNESGAGNFSTDERKATYFGSRFGAEGVDHLLVTDRALALETAIDIVPEMNAALIIVNSETYGGSGGAVAVFSRAPEAVEIALHEIGHSHFGLADEYATWGDCSDPNRARYHGEEPVEPNVTSLLAPLKWEALASGSPPFVMSNPNCDDCNPEPSPFPENAIGAFEGAKYHRCGIYRPSFNCRMRKLGMPFCAVCQNVIRRVLEPYMPSNGGRRRSVRSGGN